MQFYEEISRYWDKKQAVGWDCNCRFYKFPLIGLTLMVHELHTEETEKPFQCCSMHAMETVLEVSREIIVSNQLHQEN